VPSYVQFAAPQARRSREALLPIPQHRLLGSGYGYRKC
jgi:hypothetical protein